MQAIEVKRKELVDSWLQHPNLCKQNTLTNIFKHQSSKHHARQKGYDCLLYTKLKLFS